MAKFQRFREFRPHPWHGLPVGPDPPRFVTAYIEIGPLDTVKYENARTAAAARAIRRDMTGS